MEIHIVRHAHAGSRSRWEGDDALRPLSAKGELQVVGITDALAREPIDAIWSSHYLRCRQTVMPLAEKLGLDVVDHDELAEGAYGTDALDALLAAANAGRTIVASSHGDVIPEVLAAAVRRGAELIGPTSPSKGARYVLTVEDGAVTKAVHHPRPEV